MLMLLKCASRSMIASRPKKHRKGDRKMPKEVHAFVRDPLERLRSVYQFFKKGPPIIGETERTMPWEKFIDYVLAGKDNPHWRPASVMIERLGHPNVIVHRFEDLGTEYPLGDLPQRNKSKKMDDLDMNYRKDELLAFYADDIKLREGAKK